MFLCKLVVRCVTNGPTCWLSATADCDRRVSGIAAPVSRVKTFPLEDFVGMHQVFQRELKSTCSASHLMPVGSEVVLITVSVPAEAHVCALLHAVLRILSLLSICFSCVCALPCLVTLQRVSWAYRACPKKFCSEF